MKEFFNNYFNSFLELFESINNKDLVDCTNLFKKVQKNKKKNYFYRKWGKFSYS